MRIIRYTLFYLLLFISIILIGFVTSQRILLYVGKQQLISAVTQLRASSNQATYTYQCQQISQELGTEAESMLFQLRFEDDQVYVLEGVCAVVPDRPLEISRDTLPRFVTKVPGTSGLDTGPETTRVTLQAFRDVSVWFQQHLPRAAAVVSPTATVSMTDGVVNADTSGDQPAARGPKATCSGYGFVCCDAVAQVGEGEVVAATDCSERCYARCQPRPTILSFTAAPNFDQIARVVTISPNQEVEFRLIADSETVTTVKIDFGDGQNYSGPLSAQPVVHSYSCLQETCTYQAVAQVVNNSGKPSIQGINSSLRILVTRGYQVY